MMLRCRRFFLPLGLSCFAAFLVLFRLPSQAGEKPAKVERPRLAVLVVFDQMRADYLTRWKEHYVKDGFRRLQTDGAWFQNCHYPYAFTWTASGHASLLTGCSPWKHGIISNEWYDRADGDFVTSVSNYLYETVPAPAGKKVLGASPSRRLVLTLGDVLIEYTDGKGRVVSISLKD